MATTVTVGKARLFTATVTNPDGSPNLIATISANVSGGQIRITVNPANNREVAVVGLAAIGDVFASLTVNTGEGPKSAIEHFAVVSGAVTGLSGVVFGTAGPEIVPPSWA